MPPAYSTHDECDLVLRDYIAFLDPKHQILEEAESVGANCIFLGSRGLNRFERFMTGSVSTAVAARARCSVEVVR